MLRNKKTILRDPRYADFCVRYYDNLTRYVCENSRHKPSWQQIDLMEAIEKPGCRVACASGHGSGKSFLMAWLIDWHLRVYPNSNALLTATNAEQCRSVVWKYLDEVQADVSRNWPWQTDYFVKETKRYYAKGFKDSWYCIPKTASKSNPENLAGQHNKNYIVICDEASGIADEIHGVLRGALTHKNNRYVMMSQPTRPTGHFAEAFSSLSNIYTTFHLNAEESPLVDLEFINEKLTEYAGHHSPEYQIKVLGQFPDNMSGFLIPMSWCREGQNTIVTHNDQWGWVISVDVAEGNYRDSSVWTLAKVSGYGSERVVEVVEMHEYLGLDERSFACEIAKVVQNLQTCTVAVDAAGSGRTVVLELESQGITVDRLHWGVPPHSESERKRYRNLRAYSCVMVREALRTKRLRLPQGEKIIKQASRLPYSFDEMGRYLMTSKDEMRSKGIKSPDILDTIAFMWLVDYVPAGDGSKNSAAGEDQNSMLAWADAILNGDNDD